MTSVPRPDEPRPRIDYECDCGEVFSAEVYTVTYEPVGGAYGPCPQCGSFTTPGGGLPRD